MRESRALPAAGVLTIAAMLATAVVVRSQRSSSRSDRSPQTERTGTARGTPLGDSGVVPPLFRGALPSSPARVGDHGARMIHGDSHHTNRAYGRGPRRANVAWATQVGGAIEAQVVASPDEQTLYAASLDGALTALGRDGVTRWRVPLGDRAYSTPCVAEDGTIYVGSDAKRFFAIVPDGRIKWKLEVDGEADTGASIAPDGTIVFAAGKQVYAVRAGGDVAWRFTAKSKVFTAPAIGDDGAVFFGSQDHHVYALTRGGALAASIDLGADVDGAPAIGDEGAVYVGTDGDEVVRIEARPAINDVTAGSDAGDSGSNAGAWQIGWRTNVGGFVRGTLAIARNGDVVAGVYGPLPRMVRLGATDGTVRGAFSVQGTGAHEFGVHGAALEDDIGTMFFGAQDDDVYSVNIDGTVAWRFSTGGDVDAPLTLLRTGELVVGSDDGKVYLFAP